MKQSKQIFAVLAILFVALLIYASYDISRRTTFPGGKGQLKERIRKQYSTENSSKEDSVRSDSVPQ